VIDTDQVTEPKLSRKGKEIDAWYAGKTHDFGGLIHALMDPRGIPLWSARCAPEASMTSPPPANWCSRSSPLRQ
jgi:hypothetical protein